MANENNAELAKAKLESVVIIGGVKQENDAVFLDLIGFPNRFASLGLIFERHSPRDRD